MPNILCKKIFLPKIHLGLTLNPSWSNLKWGLFMNSTVLYRTLLCNGPVSGCCKIELGSTYLLWDT